MTPEKRTAKRTAKRTEKRTAKRTARRTKKRTAKPAALSSLGPPANRRPREASRGQSAAGAPSRAGRPARREGKDSATVGAQGALPGGLPERPCRAALAVWLPVRFRLRADVCRRALRFPTWSLTESPLPAGPAGHGDGRHGGPCQRPRRGGGDSDMGAG